MTASADAGNFERLLIEVRPSLHRYCARMAGSVIDGEDIVQDALLKAHAARPSAGSLDNPRAWVFRIAHNTALDFLRHRAREPVFEDDTAVDLLAAADAPDPDLAATCLRTFVRLPSLQRSAVILKDVLGHSLDEAAAIVGASTVAVKAALQRGRARLPELAHEMEELPLARIDDVTHARLFAYVDGFKSGDFDAVRAMLAEDVRLDLVARLQRSGKNQVGDYFGRYAECEQWLFAAGAAEGRPAMLVFDRGQSTETPAYFVLLDFDGERVTAIRDFLFARYAMDGIDLRALPAPRRHK